MELADAELAKADAEGKLADQRARWLEHDRRDAARRRRPGARPSARTGRCPSTSKLGEAGQGGRAGRGARRSTTRPRSSSTAAGDKADAERVRSPRRRPAAQPEPVERRSRHRSHRASKLAAWRAGWARNTPAGSSERFRHSRRVAPRGPARLESQARIAWTKPFAEVEAASREGGPRRRADPALRDPLPRGPSDGGAPCWPAASWHEIASRTRRGRRSSSAARCCSVRDQREAARWG